MVTPISRRSFIVTSGFAALAAAPALARVAGVPPRGLPDMDAPANNLQALVRMTASLKEEDVPWWYNGTVYAVVPGENPRPLMGFEGMELYWMSHLADGAYELTGNTVTFFTDLATGGWLERFNNPWTGAVNTPAPAVQGGGPGRGFNYSVNGIRFTKVMAQIPDQPLRLNWTFLRGEVWLANDTAYPPGMPAPRAQSQTMFASQLDFMDERLRRIPAVFSSTVHMPWLKWMEMGDRPGHLVWHASGAKLPSVDALPDAYRARAEREFPKLLTADPAKAAERMPPAH